MDDPIYCERRVISQATSTFVKCYSPKSFSSFKASLELSFIRIMQAHMLQRLFETFVQPNSCKIFLLLLICRIYRLLCTGGIWLVGVSLANPAALNEELLLRIQAIQNSLPQADIQKLFDSIPCHKPALITARGGYTKYKFRTLNFFFFENFVIYFY